MYSELDDINNITSQIEPQNQQKKSDYDFFPFNRLRRSKKTLKRPEEPPPGKPNPTKKAFKEKPPVDRGSKRLLLERLKFFQPEPKPIPVIRINDDGIYDNNNNNDDNKIYDTKL